ncbi:hypothetical protein PEX1_045650 [Penicillium expansum]|uniref:Phosphatidylinositol N-acetylglucosaminyltransferase subunit H conserved domain-containing protein n=1 Tax=Penicillium expansum TaxID=27334 RepID=A0A0A2IHJ9_PENEN|nr:hypothetical protein PEX2_026530 [Penicillium expansum]KGO42577.1 hypothetical protein PEXP_024480 [Penicillium expansum]KGO50330.1 hypothetical protein PEX2_026530 [Penicillium expansum]KGO64281.1 hypothetical protein PEX1_045650 [Penicillium expansum]
MAGRLKVQRPSPTTVSFTVSNAPQRSSSPAKILFGLQVLLRTVLFFCVIGVGIARVRNFFFQEDEESLLVIRGFGIQTSTSSSTYLSTASTRFIPTTQIQDIVIHEAFKGFEVRFYLAVIVEGEPDALVVFPHMLPKREILEQVWRGSRRCLYDAKS